MGWCEKETFFSTQRIRVSLIPLVMLIVEVQERDFHQMTVRRLDGSTLDGSTLDGSTLDGYAGDLIFESFLLNVA